MQNTMGYKGYVSTVRLVGLVAVISGPMANVSAQGMFFLFGSFDFFMGVFVYLFVPETKGVSLEKMDELFGMTDRVKQLDEEPEAGRAREERGPSVR